MTASHRIRHSGGSTTEKEAMANQTLWTGNDGEPDVAANVVVADGLLLLLLLLN
jgi:hypothetical protein